MPLFRGLTEKFLLSPDDGGVGGAPPGSAASPDTGTPSATSGGNSASPGAESTVSPEAGTTQPDPEIQNLRSKLKASAQKMRDETTIKTDPQPEAKDPAGQHLHDSRAPEKPPEAPTTTEKAPEGDKPPEGKTPETNPEEGAKPPTEYEVMGEKFSQEDIEAHVKYAREAHAFLSKQGNVLQQKEAELAKREGEFKAMTENNPDLAILRTLKEQPVLREKFFELAAEILPQLKGEHGQLSLQEELAAVKKELSDLKSGISTKEQDAQMKAEKERNEAKLQYVRQTTQQAIDFTLEQGREAKIPDSVLRSIINDTAALVESGQLKFEPEALKGHISQAIGEIVGFRKDGARGAVDEFVSGQRKLPPPPPSGGGVPRINERPKTLEDATRRLQSRLDATRT